MFGITTEIGVALHGSVVVDEWGIIAIRAPGGKPDSQCAIEMHVRG